MRQLKISTSITNRDSQAVEKYLQEISKIEMITPEEEVRLAIIRKENAPGSKEYQAAVDRLANANLRFGVSVAKQYQHQGLSLSDLISEANYGLIKAAQRFDETKGFKFISYAVRWVRQSILQAIAEQGRMVRLPQNKIGVNNKVSKAIEAFEQKYERFPSDEELSEILDMTLEEVEEIRMMNKRHESLDAPIGNEDGADSITLLDTIRSTQNDIFIGFDNHKEQNGSIYSALDIVFPEENIDTITDPIKKDNAIKRLRNKEIIFAHFGMRGYTIEYIEQKYDLTKERIRQIKEKTIRSLIHNKNFIRVLKGEEEKIPHNYKKPFTSPAPTAVRSNGKPIRKNSIPAIYNTIPSHSIYKKNEKKDSKRNTNTPNDTQLVGKILHYIIVHDNRHEEIETILQKHKAFIPLVQEVFNTYKLGNKNDLGLSDIISNAKDLQKNYKNGVNSVKQAIGKVVG